MQHTETMVIDQPLEAIWELVGNPSRWSDWMDGLTDVKLEGQPRVGASFKYKLRGEDRQNSITRYIDDQEISIFGDEINYSYTESIMLRSMGETTMVSIAIDYQPKVWWAVALTPVFFAVKKLSVGRPMRKSLDGLRVVAERSHETAIAA